MRNVANWGSELPMEEQAAALPGGSCCAVTALAGSSGCRIHSRSASSIFTRNSMAEEEWRVATGGRKHRKGGRGGTVAAGLLLDFRNVDGHAAAPPLAELHSRSCSFLHAGPHHIAATRVGNDSSSCKPPTERQVQQRCAAVDAAAREVAAAPLWRHLSQQLGALPPHCALPAVRHMVMYGLGSLEQPGAVHIRYQLALATLLAAALPPAAAPPVAFDPVFTPLDRAVLAHFRIEVR